MCTSIVLLATPVTTFVIGPFDDLLLKTNVFAILTKNIDWDVTHITHIFCEGHNLRLIVKAQEPGVRCIQKLIKIGK